jgi:ubiquitin-associated SH3 domain-containing protein
LYKITKYVFYFIQDYYQRSFNSTKYLNNLHQNEGANVLVVGHAGTLEVCTRQMCGLPVRSYTEFNATIRKVPYLGLCVLEKDLNTNLFEIQPAVIPSLGHTANFNFDPYSLKV